MSYLKKGLSGIVFILFASLLANFVGYLTRAILARNIPLADFGLFYAVYSFIMLLLLFVNLGYGSAMVKFLAAHKAKKDYEGIGFLTAFSSTIRIGFAVFYGVLIFLLADWLATGFFQAPQAVLVLQIFAVILVVFTVNKIFGNIFNGFQHMGKLAVYRFSEKALFFVFVMLFLYLGPWEGAELPTYALLAAFVGLATLSILLFIPTFKYFAIPKRYNKRLGRRMTGFAFSSLLIALGTMIIGYIDTLILTFYRPLEEVGIYNAVLPTIIMLAFVGKSVFNVFFPMVAELWEKGLRDKLNVGIRLIHRYSALVVMPMMLVFLVFPELVLNLLFGAEYVQGALAMQILSIGIIFFTIATIDQGTLSGIGKPQEVTKIIAIASVFNIFSNLALIPAYGINGAAVTTTLSYLLMMVLISFKMNKLVGITIDLRVLLKIFLAGAVFVAIVTLLKKCAPFKQLCGSRNLLGGCHGCLSLLVLFHETFYV